MDATLEHILIANVLNGEIRFDNLMEIISCLGFFFLVNWVN